MIDALIRLAIRQRVVVLALTLMLVAAGLYAVRQTPVDAIPDLSDVQVIVKTAYPGQTPQLVEDQVTYPLTTALLSVPGAVNVRGYSFFGDSYIYVIFADGTDPYWARSRVLEYLSQAAAQLPPSVRPVLGPDASGVGWVYQYALVDRSGRHDISQLRSLQDWFLRFELQALPGVAEVASIGGMQRQYQVVADPDRLRAHQLPLAHLAAAIRRANRDTGASVIELAEAEYMVHSKGYLHGIDDIARIPLGQNRDGAPLMLGDVAEIRSGPAMRRGVAELNGEGEVVGAVVIMRQGGNARQTIAAVKQRLEELKAGLPEGIEMVTVYDRSALIDRSVATLWQTLLVELLVVAGVCLLFLRQASSALVAIISLPVGILAAFVVMHWLGINANIMSLGGIAVAIGTMVDGAIVMVDNLQRHRQKTPLTDDNRWQLVSQAATEVGPALFFSLLVITVSFLPVFALQAQEGRLFTPLAWTKTLSMAAAALLAVTLVPVLMGYCLRKRPARSPAATASRLARAYRHCLKQVLAHPGKILAAAALLALASCWPASQSGSEFMPALDEGDLMYMPTTLPGLSIDKARELLQQTDRLIRTVPEVDTVFGKAGRADSATDPAPLTMFETLIQLKPKDQWRPGMTMEKLQQELNQRLQIPGLSNAWVMPIRTRIDMQSTGIRTPLGIRITGPDLAGIQHIGEQLESLLAGLPGTASVYAERLAGGRYITIDIDRAAAARYGLAIDDVQLHIASAIGGINLTETIEGRERYSINLRYPQQQRNSPEKLQQLPVITADGQQLALGDIADIRISDGPAMIKSENARLAALVLVDIDGNDIGSYIRAARQRVDGQLQLPPGYSLHWGGQHEYLQRAAERLALIVPLTVLLIALLLYIHSRNVGEVMLILLSLPIALSGGIWLLHWLDYDYSVAVAVGFIALAGLAVETSVIMLLYLDQAWHELVDSNKPLDKNQLQTAIIDGASLRVRPVLMTATADIAGFLPILFSRGTGSEVMARIAAPVVGGMLSVIAVTLLLVPAAYLLWRLRQLPGE